jgi:hypothetical protein
MIRGESKTEAVYRALMLDSSSSLKEFSLDRKKYYKKYILGENVEEPDTQAVIMGKLVETFLFEPDLFDDRFHLSSCANAPTGLMLAFVESLYKFTKEATDEDTGTITRTFEDISKDAYAESGFKIKYEAVINKFVGSDAEIYYKEIREVRSKSLVVVTGTDVENAEKIVETLKTDEFVSKIVNTVSDIKYTVHNQMQIEGYSVDGHLFKSMIDKVIINHDEKKIYIYDLKCVWAVENFYEEYYLYRRAYIQAFLYYEAVKSLTLNESSDLYQYDVVQPRFIVCDSIGYYSPLIYTLSESDIEDAYIGFKHKNREYVGVKELIQNLSWALKNNIWNISRKNYINNGMVNLRG